MKKAILPAVLVCFTLVSHAQEGAAPPELTESSAERYVSPEDRSFNKPDNAVKDLPASKENSGSTKSNTAEKSQKQTIQADTKQVKAKAEKAPSREMTHEEDDVLSFNFLYYLFQRFKSTDLADQK